MADLLRGLLLRTVGLNTVPGATGGNASGRVNALLPLVVGSTKAQVTYPATSSGTTLTIPDTSFGTSGWTTVLSSGTLSAHMLSSILVNATFVSTTSSGTREYECQVATGAAGAEVLKASVHLVSAGVFPVLPPIQWPTNERVSARAAGNTTGPNVTVTVGFAPRPI